MPLQLDAADSLEMTATKEQIFFPSLLSPWVNTRQGTVDWVMDLKSWFNPTDRVKSRNI